MARRMPRTTRRVPHHLYTHPVMWHRDTCTEHPHIMKDIGQPIRRNRPILTGQSTPTHMRRTFRRGHLLLCPIITATRIVHSIQLGRHIATDDAWYDEGRFCAGRPWSRLDDDPPGCSQLRLNRIRKIDVTNKSANGRMPIAGKFDSAPKPQKINTRRLHRLTHHRNVGSRKCPRLLGISLDQPNAISRQPLAARKLCTEQKKIRKWQWGRSVGGGSPRIEPPPPDVRLQPRS